MIAELQNHFIVCGFGRVGRNASFELQRGKFPFVVVDRSEPRVQRATMAGMLAVMADATRDECLKEVGVTRARGLIAALPSDAENLFIILSAKTLNPNLTVATRASEEEAEQKLRRAGAGHYHRAVQKFYEACAKRRQWDIREQMRAIEAEFAGKAHQEEPPKPACSLSRCNGSGELWDSDGFVFACGCEQGRKLSPKVLATFEQLNAFRRASEERTR